MEIDEQLRRELTEHIYAGRILLAIRLLREHTGLGLSGAAGYIDRMKKSLEQSSPEKSSNSSGTDKKSPVDQYKNKQAQIKYFRKIEKIKDRNFLRLKKEIESYERLCGYYIIDLVSIAGLKRKGLTHEEILDILCQHFDDHEWPPPAQRPADQTWEEDYKVDEQQAREHVVASLSGGPDIGHTVFTIPQRISDFFWQRFNEFLGRTGGIT